jgi:hypothetical protein
LLVFKLIIASWQETSTSACLSCLTSIRVHGVIRPGRVEEFDVGAEETKCKLR